MSAGAEVRLAALRARLSVSGGRLSCRDAAEREGKGLAPRDRGLLLNLVAGTTRHQLTLDHLASRHASRGLGKLDPPVREALRVGAFQLAFSRIPPHAAVAATVEAAKALSPKGAGTVNAVLRAIGREIRERGPASPSDDPLRTLPDGTGQACRFSVPILPEGNPADLLSIRLSLPGWLASRWVARFGLAEAERLGLLALGPPALMLRPRGPDLAAKLREAGHEAEALPSSAVRVLHAGDPTALPGWAEGAFSVQDPTAQAVVSEGVKPQPGEKILDLCAGVGGKACALAEQGASVLAVDTSTSRLEKLRATAARLGLANLEIQAGDALAPIPAWQGVFDAVLLDAPCTNTGVLRRRPEARWRLGPEDPKRMAALQGRLLEAASLCVKPGGRLVYSTCSLEIEENEEATRYFLQAHPGFQIEAKAFTLPSENADGGYWVRLRRP